MMKEFENWWDANQVELDTLTVSAIARWAWASGFALAKKQAHEAAQEHAATRTVMEFAQWHRLDDTCQVMPVHGGFLIMAYLPSGNAQPVYFADPHHETWRVKRAGGKNE